MLEGTLVSLKLRIVASVYRRFPCLDIILWFHEIVICFAPCSYFLSVELIFMLHVLYTQSLYSCSMKLFSLLLNFMFYTKHVHKLYSGFCPAFHVLYSSCLVITFQLHDRAAVSLSQYMYFISYTHK